MVGIFESQQIYHWDKKWTQFLISIQKQFSIIYYSVYPPDQFEVKDEVRCDRESRFILFSIRFCGGFPKLPPSIYLKNEKHPLLDEKFQVRKSYEDLVNWDPSKSDLGQILKNLIRRFEEVPIIPVNPKWTSVTHWEFEDYVYGISTELDSRIIDSFCDDYTSDFIPLFEDINLLDVDFEQKSGVYYGNLVNYLKHKSNVQLKLLLDDEKAFRSLMMPLLNKIERSFFLNVAKSQQVANEKRMHDEKDTELRSKLGQLEQENLILKNRLKNLKKIKKGKQLSQFKKDVTLLRGEISGNEDARQTLCQKLMARTIDIDTFLDQFIRLSKVYYIKSAKHDLILSNIN